VEESKGGAKPTTPMKRRLGTTGLRTQLESPKSSKQRKVAPLSVIDLIYSAVLKVFIEMEMIFLL